jgi:NADH dehydrogenase
VQFDVLIIGGGAAGLAAATRLRRRAPELSVTVAALRVGLSDFAREHGFTFRNGRVEAVDLEAGTALLAGEQIGFRAVLVAAGAPADRDAVPGAREHALFPCDPPDAEELAARLADGCAELVFVLTGERVGPGLEFAAWVAEGAARSGRGVRVTVVGDEAAVGSYLGTRSTRVFASRLGEWGGRYLSGAVKHVDATGVWLAEGEFVPADQVAVVGPLAAPCSGLPAEVLDRAGFLVVEETFRSPRHASLFGAGDAITVPGQTWRRSWLLSVSQAEKAADNVVAALRGEELSRFDPVIGRRLARTSVPDLAGSALLIVNLRLVASGRWVHWLRVRMDRLHFARYGVAGRLTVRRPGRGARAGR